MFSFTESGKYVADGEKGRSVEKENRLLKSEISTLKKQVSRLRKKLAKYGPQDEYAGEEEQAELPPVKEVKHIDTCPDCQADIVVVLTPNGKGLACCKAKCGFRKKVG